MNSDIARIRRQKWLQHQQQQNGPKENEKQVVLTNQALSSVSSSSYNVIDLLEDSDNEDGKNQKSDSSSSCIDLTLDHSNSPQPKISSSHTILDHVKH